MTKNQKSKFAFLISDPSNQDEPLISTEALQGELTCHRAINLVLNSPDAKNNPTSSPIKCLKYLKENYFPISSLLELYDSNNFVTEHFLFVYAFSEDANYTNLVEFNNNLKGRYGNVSFIPFSLSKFEANEIQALDQLKSAISELFTNSLSNSECEFLKSKFAKLINQDLLEDLEKIIQPNTSSKKLLTEFIEKIKDRQKIIFTNGWNDESPIRQTAQQPSKPSLKNWIIQPYHKKSIQETEFFRKEDFQIAHSIGWRWGSWLVTTNDGQIPQFKFEIITGGSYPMDSINMNDCLYNNIENVELIETSDGCWEDTEFPEEMDEEEVERLQELMDDAGSYILEDDEGWSIWETEMWITGPIEILNEDKECIRIITANEDGEAVDYTAN